MAKKRQIILIILLILAILLVFCMIFAKKSRNTVDVGASTCLFIDNDDDIDSVRSKLITMDCGVNIAFFDLLAKITNYKSNIHTGRYIIPSNFTTINLLIKLRGHRVDPLMLVIPSVRTIPELAGRISNQIMVDSVTLVRVFSDDSLLESLGYDKHTFVAFFIPNSYEVYWDISVEKLIDKLKNGNESFWTQSRLSKARELGMSTIEVATLASIIDSETSVDDEKPSIAGLYINRLNKGMKLQSDPTVIYALGDFSIKRVYDNQLKFDSPYNTYKYKGLPPGPIRIPSIAGIDAVLNYERNDYLFMCAKEDLSGTHNFASTGTEHAINARKYQQALNNKGIRK
ncbi:MAG: endolytic transglycosylase MltG [Bacteroidaceae bacterium]|nr:endolytic transglycosylase MltG [Bacteroidaceae bacterium]